MNGRGWDHKESSTEEVMLLNCEGEDFESPLLQDQSVNPEGNQLEYSLEKLIVEAHTLAT